MTLGQKLRQARVERGMTQSQVAGDWITRNMLSQIENDLASPSVKTLEYLASTLGVGAGWLLEDGPAVGTDSLEGPRALYREGQYRACVQQVLPLLPGDEAYLLGSMAQLNLAERQLAAEEFESANGAAQQALDWNRRSLYAQNGVQIRAAAVIARCQAGKPDEERAVEEYRALCQGQALGVQYHLLLARYHLAREHMQAAEREIWSIAELPEQCRAEYLILRGRIALRKEQYENASLYLLQAEDFHDLSRLLRRELYQALEHCYKELEDYKLAYEYAARQLAL